MEHRQQIQETVVISAPEQAAALLHPVRSELVSLLKQEASATELAKSLNETPQKINYHLKTLQKVGLIQQVGTRKVRNLIEVLYQAVGKSFLLSDSLGLPQETMQKLQDQSALAHVLSLTEKMKKAAISLMEQAEEEVVPTAIIEANIELPDKDSRNRFLSEYTNLLTELIEKYQAKTHETSNPYCVSLAVYPKPKGDSH